PVSEITLMKSQHLTEIFGLLSHINEQIKFSINDVFDFKTYKRDNKTHKEQNLTMISEPLPYINEQIELSENLYEKDNKTHREQHLTEISGPLSNINKQIELSENLYERDNETYRGQHLTKIFELLPHINKQIESYERDNKTYKGQHLTEISRPLPHINEQIEFSINDTFSICNKTDKNGHLTNLFYKCKFDDTYQAKKTVNLQSQHNKSSKKVNCTWKPNLSLATGFIHIISLDNHHVKHQLLPDTRIFAPINCRFSDKCHKDICHLVVSRQYDLSTIRSLLSSKYPNQPFFTRNLANTVAQLRQEYRVIQNLEKATEIPPRVLITDKDLSMKHVSKLGKQYSDFIKDFYQAYNSLSKSVFEISKQIDKYLMPNLVAEQQKQIVQFTIYQAQVLLLSNTNLNNQSNFANFHIMLLPIRWCKNEVTESKRSQEPFLIASCNTELAPITHQLSTMTNMNLFRIDNNQENKFQERIEKKAITLQDSDKNDYELETFLKNYVEKKKIKIERETQQKKFRIFKEYQNSDILSIQIGEQLVSIENVADPAYHVSKEVLYKKCIKGEQEKYQ
ncbi:26729_t:CDS:2, partial [Dentiscutata erythropus]